MNTGASHDAGDAPPAVDDTGVAPASSPLRPSGRKWTIRAALGVGLALAGGAGWWLVFAIGEAREAAARASCNLGGIGLALYNYHDVHGALPPPVVYSPEGEPLYSWRVLLLPYIDGVALYKEFRLDEPWDSAHNLRLLERMPTSYAAPWTKYVDVPPGHTVIKVFVGPGTLFEEGRHNPLPALDADADTLLFVEAGEPVPWTKPEDIPYDPARPVRLRGLFRDGLRAYGLSRRRFIAHDTDQQTLHSLITRKPGTPQSVPDGEHSPPSGEEPVLLGVSPPDRTR